MKIPKLTDRSPRLLQLLDQQFKLQIQKGEKVSETTTIRKRINENQTTFGNSAENRVRAVLGEPMLPSESPDMERLDVLLRELQDINAALARLDSAIQKEQADTSRLICDELRPEVTAKAKAFAKAFLALHTAHSEYERVLESIENTGVNTTSLGRVWPHALGGVKDRSGAYHYAFEEFVDAGYLAKAEVPECVR